MKHKKKIICAIIFILYILNQPQLVIKTATIQIEYGKRVSTNITDYIDTKKSSKKLIKSAKLDLTNIKNEKDKAYPAIGEYPIKIISSNKKHNLVIKITDTTKPKFIDFKEVIELFKGAKPTHDDLTHLFDAKDLSKTSITIDDSKVDYF